jgi:polyisoprenoid-binding protein YceI
MKAWHARVGAALLLAAAAVACPAQDGTYAIDPTHTTVHFEMLRFGLSTTRGRFDRKEGSVQFDRAGLRGSVEIAVDTRSLNTGVAALDRRLQEADFLDTEAFPSARFSAGKLAFGGNRVAAVEGTLTLRGQTHPLTLAAQRFDCYLNPLFRREVCGGDFEADLELARWGIAARPELGIPERVRLIVQVEAIRQ